MLVYFATGVLCSLGLYYHFSRCKTKLPPGPLGIPVLGHIFQVPQQHTWRYFEKLSKFYGSLFRLTLGGNEILVLCSPQDAEELLVRRSNNYSSRKPLIYAGKYQSNNKRLVLLPYGETLRKHRAAFYQMMQPKAVGSYEGIQEIESTKLLYDMLRRPKESTRNFGRYSASLVFHLSYGKRLADDDRDFLTIRSILNGFVRDMYPGSHLVDLFPVLDCLPDILAPWRAEALRKHESEKAFYERLVLDVKSRMDTETTAVECFAARLWDQQSKLELSLEEIAYVAGSAFEAGTDTTTGTFLWFIMAMVLFPETMRKAQEEIDGLLGEDGRTMPSFANTNNLPYCTALAKEVFRWAPAAPGGFPHYSDREDQYKGYTIKQNTMVIPCIWAMHRNEDEYPDASTFDPGRFLSQSLCDKEVSLTDGHYGFGFGRRQCPGQYLGSRSVWIGIIKLLWAFNILPAIDKNTGLAVPVDPDCCTSGMTSQPFDFPFRIEVRSENHAKTIMENWKVFR